MLESEFNKLSSPKLTKDQKNIKKQFNSIELKAEDIISNISNFTFEQFELLYFDDHISTSNVFDLFDSEVLELKEQDRVGTADAYEKAANSLKRFKSDMMFGDITPKFLGKYEKAMIEGGATCRSVGFYLRALRRNYNIAVDTGLARRVITHSVKTGAKYPLAVM